MLDSTARAERLDLTSSEPASYTWEAAQKPVAVRLPLALIDRLESEAVETFRSLSSRGSEIGGLLLGGVVGGNPSLVTVSDFELIPCDYSRGPLYRLSDIDLGRFEQAIERHASGAAPRVVGYFRSHTRKGLSLDAEDISFFEPRFLEPQHVVLLIRPFATKVSSAGIFIRESGRIGETSYLEFPFRSAELMAAKHGGEKSEAAGQGTQTAPAPTPVTAPKQALRAQIVPIASRREITLPEPAPSPQPAIPIVAVPIVANRVESPAPPPRKNLPAAVLAVDTTPVAAPEVKSPKPAPPEAKHAPEPAPAAEIALDAPPKNKKLRLVVAAAIGMVVLVGGMVVLPTLRNRLFPSHTTVQQDSSPLSLRVERTAGGMLLTWNRDLPVIQNATSVMLSITDGDRHEKIKLDPNQARSGSVLYPPLTGDVSFELEVTDPHQTKTTSESLRMLDPRPSPLADPNDTSAQTKAQPPAAKPTATPAPVESAAVEEPKQQEESSAPHSAPLKHFNTESLAERLRPVTAADLPDAPSIARTTTAGSATLPGIVGSQAAPLPPARPSPSAPASTSVPAPPVNTSTNGETGGQLRPAILIGKIDPEYPRLARQAGASGVVELEATIGTDGKVRNPRVVKGNSMLQKAAIDAVLQWHYRPATLNGKPVDSPVDIKLNFVPAH